MSGNEDWLYFFVVVYVWFFCMTENCSWKAKFCQERIGSIPRVKSQENHFHTTLDKKRHWRGIQKPLYFEYLIFIFYGEIYLSSEIFFIKNFRGCCIPWAGNYFRSRATLRLFRCLAGQIPVKKAIIKLKICSLRAGHGQRAVCCPLLLYTVVYSSLKSKCRLNFENKLQSKALPFLEILSTVHSNHSISFINSSWIKSHWFFSYNH